MALRFDKWMVADGGQYLHFRKSIQPFQSFKLITKIHSFNDKWIYVEHKSVDSFSLSLVAMLLMMLLLIARVFKVHGGIHGVR